MSYNLCWGFSLVFYDSLKISFPGFLWCLLIVYPACYASDESSSENIPLAKRPCHRLKFTLADFPVHLNLALLKLYFFFFFNKKP